MNGNWERRKTTARSTVFSIRPSKYSWCMKNPMVSVLLTVDMLVTFYRQTTFLISKDLKFKPRFTFSHTNVRTCFAVIVYHLNYT